MSCLNRYLLRRSRCNRRFLRKAVFEEACLALKTWLGELLLPCSYHQPADVAYANNQTMLPFGLALACVYQGITLGVFGSVGPTPLRVALWGPWWEFSTIDDWCVAMGYLSLVVLGRLARDHIKMAISHLKAFLYNSPVEEGVWIQSVS